MSRSPVRFRQLARKGERVEHPDAIGKVAGSPEGTPVEDSCSWLGREKEERVEHPDAIGKVTHWIPAVGSEERKGKS